MNERMLIVTDRIRAREGLAANLAAELVPAFNAECRAALQHGALAFELLEAEKREEGYLMVQHWSSRNAFEAFHIHHRPRELQEFLKKVPDLIDRPLDQVAKFWRAHESSREGIRDDH